MSGFAGLNLGPSEPALANLTRHLQPSNLAPIGQPTGPSPTAAAEAAVAAAITAAAALIGPDPVSIEAPMRDSLLVRSSAPGPPASLLLSRDTQGSSAAAAGPSEPGSSNQAESLGRLAGQLSARLKAGTLKGPLGAGLADLAQPQGPTNGFVTLPEEHPSCLLVKATFGSGVGSSAAAQYAAETLDLAGLGAPRMGPGSLSQQPSSLLLGIPQSPASAASAAAGSDGGARACGTGAAAAAAGGAAGPSAAPAAAPPAGAPASLSDAAAAGVAAAAAAAVQDLDFALPAAAVAGQGLDFPLAAAAASAGESPWPDAFSAPTATMGIEPAAAGLHLAPPLAAREAYASAPWPNAVSAPTAEMGIMPAAPDLAFPDRFALTTPEGQMEHVDAAPWMHSPELLDVSQAQPRARATQYQAAAASALASAILAARPKGQSIKSWPHVQGALNSTSNTSA